MVIRLKVFSLTKGRSLVMLSTAFDFNKLLYISAAMFSSVCVHLILKEFSVCFYMNCTCRMSVRYQAWLSVVS